MGVALIYWGKPKYCKEHKALLDASKDVGLKVNAEKRMYIFSPECRTE
jgi:hypothetical protein